MSTTLLLQYFSYNTISNPHETTMKLACCRSSLCFISNHRKLTDVGHVHDLLVVGDGLISGAQLDGVEGPDGGVVFIEEALVGPVGAVVRTLAPV